MLLPDVNALVYAQRPGAHVEHARFADWVTEMATGPQPFGLPILVLVGVVRIVTNKKIFDRPSTLDEALAFVHELVSRPQARVLAPGPRHWGLVSTLRRQSRATGKLVADAQHAALAIEHGGTWITTDADFSRFPGLRWGHPLAG